MSPWFITKKSATCEGNCKKEYDDCGDDDDVDDNNDDDDADDDDKNDDDDANLHSKLGHGRPI